MSLCVHTLTSGCRFIRKAGLKQHLIQSILFQNLFLVGGRGELTEGSAFTHARGLKGEDRHPYMLS